MASSLKLFQIDEWLIGELIIIKERLSCFKNSYTLTII